MLPCHGRDHGFKSRIVRHFYWKFSSVGRASLLHGGGHRFKPYNFHHKKFQAYACLYRWHQIVNLHAVMLDRRSHDLRTNDDTLRLAGSRSAQRRDGRIPMGKGKVSQLSNLCRSTYYTVADG